MAQDPFSVEAADKFLSERGVSAKWPTVGFVVEGVVTNFTMEQQTDYDSGEPLFWEEGKRVKGNPKGVLKPVMQLLLDLQCEPTGETWQNLDNTRVELPDDDGVRTMYVKGALRSAITKALKKSRGKLEIGAHIHVTRTKDGPKSNPKFQAPHNYTAIWTPAAKNLQTANEFLDTEDNPFAS